VDRMGCSRPRHRRVGGSAPSGVVPPRGGLGVGVKSNSSGAFRRPEFRGTDAHLADVGLASGGLGGEQCAHGSIAPSVRAQRALAAPWLPLATSSPGKGARALRWRCSRDQLVVNGQCALLNQGSRLGLCVLPAVAVLPRAPLRTGQSGGS